MIIPFGSLIFVDFLVDGEVMELRISRATARAWRKVTRRATPPLRHIFWGPRRRSLRFSG